MWARGGIVGPPSTERLAAANRREPRASPLFSRREVAKHPGMARLRDRVVECVP
jgi:hypothetical protein